MTIYKVVIAILAFIAFITKMIFGSLESFCRSVDRLADKVFAWLEGK